MSSLTPSKERCSPDDAYSHTPMSQTLSPLSQGGPPRLAITHIFPCSINGLLASLKGVSFCAEPFEGAPFRVILSGSNIDRGRNYNCPCGWSKMWVIASLAACIRIGLLGSD